MKQEEKPDASMQQDWIQSREQNLENHFSCGPKKFEHFPINRLLLEFLYLKDVMQFTSLTYNHQMYCFLGLAKAQSADFYWLHSARSALFHIIQYWMFHHNDCTKVCWFQYKNIPVFILEHSITFQYKT